MSVLVSAAEEAVPNADSAQRRLVIRLARVRSPLPVKRMKARSPARPGVGRGTRPARWTASGSIRSMSIRPGGEPAVLAAAAEHVDLQAGRVRGRLGVLRVGDDPPRLAELGLAGGIAVGAHQHRDRAEPVQRGDDRQRARARLHQHADVLALADADLEQPADDVVDPLLDRRVGVGAVLEEQDDVLGSALGLLVEQQAEARCGSARRPGRGG